MRTALVLSLVLAGCGFREEPGQDGSSLDGGDSDAADDGSAGTDGLTDDGATGRDGGNTTCARPWLLVGREDLSGATNGGAVLLFTITTSGLKMCTTLDLTGTLPAQPLAVGLVPPDTIAAATRDGLYLIGPDDSPRGNWPPPDPKWLPVEVAPIRTPAGDTLAAVGWWKAGTSSPEVDEIDVYRTPGSGPAYTFSQPFDRPSFAPSPLDTGRLFVLDASSSMPAPARNVDPFGMTEPAWVSGAANATLTTIATFADAGGVRAVWVDQQSNGVYYARAISGNAPSFLGPAKWTGDPVCMLLHAVPDPTDPSGFIGLCEHSGSTVRDLVRWSSTTGPATVLLDGKTVPALERLSPRLGLAP